eukprot:scaffold44195_cov23-Cyclotella_meneghiniana.AAC.5
MNALQYYTRLRILDTLVSLGLSPNELHKEEVKLEGPALLYSRALLVLGLCYALSAFSLLYDDSAFKGPSARVRVVRLGYALLVFRA